MKSFKKIITSLFLLLILITPTMVYADTSFSSFDSMKSTADQWLQKGSQKSIVDENQIVKIMLPIGQFLTGIGAAILIIATIVLGIKYMTANPEAKGNLKQQFVGLVIAGIVILGAYGIWQIVYHFMSDLTGVA